MGTQTCAPTAGGAVFSCCMFARSSRACHFRSSVLISCSVAYYSLVFFISGYRSDCRNVAFTEVIFIIHPPPEPSTWSQSSPPMVGHTARFKYSGSSVLRLSESSFKAAALGRAAWPQDATQPSGSHVWRLDGSDAPYQLLVCANQQWNLGFTFWSTSGNACTPQASATLQFFAATAINLCAPLLLHNYPCSVTHPAGAPPTRHQASCSQRLLCSTTPTPTCKPTRCHRF